MLLQALKKWNTAHANFGQLSPIAHSYTMHSNFHYICVT